MTTQDILLLANKVHDIAIHCGGGRECYLLDVDIYEIDETLLVEGNIIDYMAGGDNVRPVVMLLRKALREFLESAAERAGDEHPRRWRLTEGARDRIAVYFSPCEYDIIEYMEWIAEGCEKWLYWIDQYFPPVEAAAHQEARPKAERPKSAAAVRLESQELQDIKKALIQAGIIAGGQWQGSPAEFGCLVLELNEFRGVGGSKAWKECTVWAGYSGSIQSARNAIENNPNTRGPIADKIRAICRAGSNARK